MSDLASTDLAARGVTRLPGAGDRPVLGRTLARFLVLAGAALALWLIGMVLGSASASASTPAEHARPVPLVTSLAHTVAGPVDQLSGTVQHTVKREVGPAVTHRRVTANPVVQQAIRGTAKTVGAVTGTARRTVRTVTTTVVDPVVERVVRPAVATVVTRVQQLTASPVAVKVVEPVTSVVTSELGDARSAGATSTPRDVAPGRPGEDHATASPATGSSASTTAEAQRFQAILAARTHGAAADRRAIAATTTATPTAVPAIPAPDRSPSQWWDDTPSGTAHSSHSDDNGPAALGAARPAASAPLLTGRSRPASDALPTSPGRRPAFSPA